MPFPKFWPEGSKIIDNPDQVAEIASRAKRAALIAEIQETLRTQSNTLPTEVKKGLLIRLSNLMEEDEVARGGKFNTEGSLHMRTKEERESEYLVPSEAANDSVKEKGKIA